MYKKQSDYYEILGIQPSASTKDIKKAYRKLAQKSHPDHNPDNPESESHFRKLTQAYDILKKEHSRAHYDFKRTTNDSYEPNYSRSEDAMPMAETVSPLTKLFDNIRLGEHDNRIHLLALVFIGLYAIVLVCGNLLQGAAFIGIMIFAIAFIIVLLRDELQDFIEEPTSRPYNVVWFIILMLVFNSAYYDRFESLFGLQFSTSYRIQGLFSGIMRFGFYLSWLAFYSEWHWLFCIWMLSIVVASFDKDSIVGGWMLFAAQLLLTTITRYNPELMSYFVIYYQPLFTIAPLTPTL